MRQKPIFRGKIFWVKFKKQYLEGKTVAELCKQYNVNPVTAWQRCHREKWAEQADEIVRTVTAATIAEQQKQLAIAHQNRVRIRAEKIYEDVDAVRNNQKKPTLESVDTISKVEDRTDLMMRRSLGMSTQNNAVDVTSGGKSIEQSFLGMLEAAQTLIDQGKVKREMIDVESIVNDIKGEE